MLYTPHQMPSMKAVQDIMEVTPILEVTFVKYYIGDICNRAEDIQQLIDVYYECKTATDYQNAFAQVLCAAGYMARDLDTGEFLRPHLSHKILRANTDGEGRAILRSIRSFYEAMRRRLGEIKPKQKINSKGCKSATRDESRRKKGCCLVAASGQCLGTCQDVYGY